MPNATDSAFILRLPPGMAEKVRLLRFSDLRISRGEIELRILRGSHQISRPNTSQPERYGLQQLIHWSGVVRRKSFVLKRFPALSWLSSLSRFSFSSLYPSHPHELPLCLFCADASYGLRGQNECRNTVCIEDFLSYRDSLIFASLFLICTRHLTCASTLLIRIAQRTQSLSSNPPIITSFIRCGSSLQLMNQHQSPAVSSPSVIRSLS